MGDCLHGIYCYRQEDEFAGDDDMQFKRWSTAYLRALDFCVTEWKLDHFSRWYADLRLSKFLANPMEVLPSSQKLFWTFKVIYLNGHNSPKKGAAAAKKNVVNALTDFYSSLFDPNDQDRKSMKSSIPNDESIIIVAYRCETQKPPTNFIKQGKKQNYIIVGAVTFRRKYFTHPGPVFVTWFGVAGYRVPAPHCLRQWRRNGFGILLLVHVIKRCSTNCGMDYPSDVSIYLQCTEETAFQFYTSCGFIPLKDKNKSCNNFSLLPKELQSCVNKKVFLDYSDVSSHLLVLKPGTLQAQSSRFAEDDSSDGCNSVVSVSSGEGDEKAVDYFWCKYPSSRFSITTTGE